jgi:hypothetical protein
MDGLRYALMLLIARILGREIIMVVKSIRVTIHRSPP